MPAGRQDIQKGWYYAAKYKGSNGDLIVGCVESVRTSGHIVLTNLLTGKTSTKKLSVLERRNKRISKPQAMKLKKLYESTKDKARVRKAAVDVQEFYEKPKRVTLDQRDIRDAILVLLTAILQCEVKEAAGIWTVTTPVGKKWDMTVPMPVKA